MMGYVDELTNATLEAGFPNELAVECSRVMVNLTIDSAVTTVRALRDPKNASPKEVRSMDETFKISVRLLLAGVRAEAGQ